MNPRYQTEKKRSRTLELLYYIVDSFYHESVSHCHDDENITERDWASLSPLRCVHERVRCRRGLNLSLTILSYNVHLEVNASRRYAHARILLLSRDCTLNV